MLAREYLYLSLNLNLITWLIFIFNILIFNYVVNMRHPGMQIVIDRQLLVLSFELKFLCVDMFPYEDSEIVSVCLSIPREKKSH